MTTIAFGIAAAVHAAIALAQAVVTTAGLCCCGAGVWLAALASFALAYRATARGRRETAIRKR